MAVSKKFVAEGIKKIKAKDVERAAKRASKAKHKANRGVLKQVVDRIHDFADMLTDYVENRYREVPWWSISAIAFAIIYVVNPIDIVPDFIPLFGLVDDLAVMTIVLAMVDQDVKAWKEWHTNHEKEKKASS